MATWAGSWFGSSCVLASLAAHPLMVHAQASGVRPSVAPAAPSSALGAMTNSATVSLMGLTALPSSEEKGVPSSEHLFMGVTQPLGHLGGVRLTAIGMGFWRMPQGVNASSAAEGAVAVRATGRLNGLRTWTAVAYGRANALGMIGSSFAPAVSGGVGLDGVQTDTTVSRREDVGSVARVESGMLGSKFGLDMSLGVSVERATRVTTQTISIQSIDNFPIVATQSQSTITRTLRSVQRREIATGLASVGWRTGSTSWQGSLSAPLYAWITRDALSPKPRIAPAVASLAVVQPITAWLSAIGSASTNASSVGSTALSDDSNLSRRGAMSPVFALGISLARVPFRGRHGENALGGILGFESRVVESLDSVIVLSDSASVTRGADSTFRVQLVIDAPAALSVELMGDATSWNIASMSRGGDGRWRAEIKVGAGAHRIAVRADGGDWIAPPGLPLSSNDFGNPVGLLLLDRSKHRN